MNKVMDVKYASLGKTKDTAWYFKDPTSELRCQLEYANRTIPRLILLYQEGKSWMNFVRREKPLSQIKGETKEAPNRPPDRRTKRKDYRNRKPNSFRRDGRRKRY